MKMQTIKNPTVIASIVIGTAILLHAILTRHMLVGGNDTTAFRLNRVTGEVSYFFKGEGWKCEVKNNQPHLTTEQR